MQNLYGEIILIVHSLFIHETLLFLQINSSKICAFPSQTREKGKRTLSVKMHFGQTVHAHCHSAYCAAQWVGKITPKRAVKKPTEDWSRGYFHMKMEFSHLFFWHLWDYQRVNKCKIRYHRPLVGKKKTNKWREMIFSSRNQLYKWDHHLTALSTAAVSTHPVSSGLKQKGSDSCLPQSYYTKAILRFAPR